MVVLVSRTTKTKPFPVRASSLGLETDAKLRKVISKSTSIIQCGDVKPTQPMITTQFLSCMANFGKLKFYHSAAHRSNFFLFSSPKPGRHVKVLVDRNWSIRWYERN